MNIIELQKQITSFLLTKSTRVYFRKAPENSVFPYVVYNLPNSEAGYSEREDIILEVDIWDNTNLTQTIDTLVGAIDGDGDLKDPTGLHRKLIYIGGSLSAKIYRENRLIIDDEDSSIERRQLRYSIQTYLL